MEYVYSTVTERGRRAVKKKKKSLALRVIIFIILALLVYQLAYKRITPGLISEYDNKPVPERSVPTKSPPPTEEAAELTELAEYYNSLEGAANEYIYLSIEKILANYKKYPIEYINLAIKHNDAMPFVADYIDFVYDENKKIDITSDILNSDIPHFMQWDKRWGYLKYGETDQDISIAGCGPTSLAMVITGLTGSKEANPKAVADFAYKSGYYVDGVGTSWGLMSEGAKSYGLKVKELPLSEVVIKNALNNGQPVIVSMRPGAFTDVGHFIVLIGVDGDGKFIVQDPNSYERSSKTWDYSVFEQEARNFWAYSYDK